MMPHRFSAAARAGVAAFCFLAASSAAQAQSADAPGPQHSVDALLASQPPADALSTVYDLRDALWSAMPLTVTEATFVAEIAPSYGSIKSRENSIFAPADTLRVYFEPVGYGHRTTGGGAEIDLSIDVAISNTTGQRIIGQDDFARVGKTTGKPSYEFGATITLAFEDFPTGDYLLELTVNDETGDKSGKVTLPFAIEAPASAAE